MSVGEANVPSPVLDYPIPGEKINFEPFSYEFNVDENYVNYLEIYDWMMEMANPDERDDIPDDKDMMSDATLTILNNQNNPIANVHFKDVWPTSLGDVQLTTQTSELITCTVTLTYSHFTIESLR